MSMQPWFLNAKLGIFIHWGIYAVDGVAESWSFYLGTVSREQYMKQLKGFTASKYDPQAWAALFKRCGARYSVLTARHHDGFSLWDTEFGDLSAERDTPAGRDLIGPYVAALREHGLRAGLYYSHSDWNHPLYPSIRSTGTDQNVNSSPYAAPQSGADDPAAWQRYLKYRDGQVEELLTRYHPDVMWFDGEWERAPEQWGLENLAQIIDREAPQAVLNGRMPGYGDYATPEQGLPMHPPSGPWELCLTINDSWGYQPQDTRFKSVGQIVRYFTETIGMGGNLLLDVGPREDGTIPEEQVERLEGLGAWIARHSEAVYGTERGLPPGYHHGPSTVSPDRRTLYLVCFGLPADGIALKGLRTPVRSATALATGTALGHRVTGGHGEVPGLTWIDAPPPDAADPHATVIAVELDGELDLYTGRGRA